MSLVLRAGERRLVLGYGELHDLRGELLRATILALEDLRAALCNPGAETTQCLPSSFERACRQLLQAFDAKPETVVWMLDADRPAPQPDYEVLPLEVPAAGLPDNVLNALSGLNWFVSHSDCDGFHSAGQCADICDWFRLIALRVRAAWKDRFLELERLYAQRQVVMFLG